MRKGIIHHLMAERVNYGGELIERGKLALRMQREGHDPRAVDHFAFGTKAVSEEAEKDFGATCACGARWLGAGTLTTCPACEEPETCTTAGPCANPAGSHHFMRGEVT